MKKILNIQKYKGFSLIEVMIAVVIGIILLGGLVKVFDTTSKMNKTQNGLARIQQNGRFAILQMKQNIEQAGYQYCMSSGEENKDPIAGSGDRGTIQRPWNVYTANPIFTGVPANQYFDTANLIHGHECDGTSCTPDFTTDGSDTSYTIPSIGTNNGDRLANTDVLTVRYISGTGLEVDSIAPGTLANQRVINLSPFSAATPAGTTPMPADSRVLVASCNDNPLNAVDVITSGAGSITVSIPNTEPFSGGSADLTRVFNLDTDVKSVTYYVANNIVDGRSIPTLYSVVNGTTNALVEGVERFDVLYAVDQGLTPQLRQYFTADQVQNMVANCKPLPVGPGMPVANVAGCGWRSIDLIEIHLLLNTIHNSTYKTDEQYVYSVDGNNLRLPSATPSSGLPTYRLHRREFFSVINLKNSPN